LTGGSLSEEPYLLANYEAHEGAEHVAVVSETTATGEELLHAFVNACRREGVKIGHFEQVSPVQTDMVGVAHRSRDAGSDAVVYLGYGFPVVELARELEAMKWEPLRVMGCAFHTVVTTPEGLGSVKGWVGVDLYDENNPVGQAFLDRFEKRVGYRPANFLGTYTYDAGQVLAHGVANGRPLSPGGVRDGLERVKWLPAASGGPGTLLNLGPFMHRAWLGPNFILWRKALEGATDWDKELPSEFCYRFTPTPTLTGG
jgi:ABC-type branched-subunit amino acid transport system substrate-binding protein